MINSNHHSCGHHPYRGEYAKNTENKSMHTPFICFGFRVHFDAQIDMIYGVMQFCIDLILVIHISVQCKELNLI